jgi:hypothetical protein
LKITTEQMTNQNTTLTIGEQIDRARDGRSQKWIVGKLCEAGVEITEVKFSNKKNGSDIFSELELQKLSELLGAEFTVA